MCALWSPHTIILHTFKEINIFYFSEKRIISSNTRKFEFLRKLKYVQKCDVVQRSWKTKEKNNYELLQREKQF